jgi:protein tyrosine phosphatase (PTP) superfamily phosphohydrolase (DUF442 family)
MLKLILTFMALTAISSAQATDLSDVSNYRQYSDLLSSSGQPSNEQLEQAAEQGFERVIYLAFTDNDSAIEHEDSTVKTLGMDYVHIPVDFRNPTVDDFKTFATVMQQRKTAKTLVHCQVNFRASTFSFLYRTIFLEVPTLEAKDALDGVWAPNETWFRFIRSVFEDYEMTHACEGCDWGEHEFIDE